MPRTAAEWETKMISLIIPFYNCAKTAESTLFTASRFINNYEKEPIELIAVNDGSTDNTLSVLKSYENEHIKVVSYEKNKGKGGAICAGVFASAGDKIIFTDADLAYGLSPIAPCAEALEEYDIAAGSRRSDREILKNYGFLRNFSSLVFSSVCEFLLHLKINDTQCGFKGYRAEAAKELFSRLTINGFGFDLEILAEARAAGMKITQIPVKLIKNEKNSKVSLISDGAKMLGEIIYIRKKVKTNKR